ncbi:hypothetical protein [Sinomonas halotolerans]|uniref:Secreted protein n=1 Tax=Sinomonas halotolerans TaxID=1644133 RepID=A0ABU9X278_9MICC
MRMPMKLMIVVPLASAGLFAAGPAVAADPNADFAQHVRMCVETMGFDGTHNPGMHEGKSGWDPLHICPVH